MAEPNIQDPLQKQAWDYFQLHAGQRLTTFNFYLVVSGIVTAAMVSTLGKDARFPLLGVILGLLLTFFSFVFRQLDQRNRYLIKNAEAALRVFEAAYLGGGSDAEELSLFTLEHREATKSKTFSYSKCFLFVFVAFGVIGIFGAGLSVALYFGPQSTSPDPAPCCFTRPR